VRLVVRKSPCGIAGKPLGHGGRVRSLRYRDVRDLPEEHELPKVPGPDQILETIKHHLSRNVNGH